MKRFLALLAVAALSAVIYVAAAPGGLQASPTAKQFAALKKQVAGLSGKVKTLQGQLSALTTDETAVKALATDADGFVHTCLIAGHAIGISQFGDPTNKTFGYTYTDNTGTYMTSALDADASSTPGAFFQAVAASCVSSGSAAAPNAGVPTERRASTLAAAGH